MEYVFGKTWAVLFEDGKERRPGWNHFELNADDAESAIKAAAAMYDNAHVRGIIDNRPIEALAMTLKSKEELVIVKAKVSGVNNPIYTVDIKPEHHGECTVKAFDDAFAAAGIV